MPIRPLMEKGGNHADKDQQAQQGARFRQLEDLLRRAVVGETPPDDGVVEPGMVVDVKLLDFDETEKFLLGARENLREGDSLTVYSPESAMGAAINGRKKGETVAYNAPNGQELKVKILDRSEEHTSELTSLMRTSYAVFCLKKTT